MPPNVTYRRGVEFFETACQVVAFVCNCTSERSIGFARRVEDRFPHVDICKNRVHKPGTIELWGNRKRGQRYVLGLFAQYSRADDTQGQRLAWFKACLEKITKQLPTLKSIAFPRQATTAECKCHYLQTIETWAKDVPHIKIEIISIEPPHERYLLNAQDGGLKTSKAAPASPPDAYIESPEYVEIDNDVYEWISRHTDMEAIPSKPEARAKLATSLSELLLEDNPVLHGKIRAIVPVEDDFFSILEQEASTDLNEE